MIGTSNRRQTIMFDVNPLFETMLQIVTDTYIPKLASVS